MSSDALACETSVQGFRNTPASWYYVANVRDISARPLGFDLAGQQSYVAFSTGENEFTVLSRRCSHLGADLTLGCVKDGRIICPLHGWEYGKNGECEHIPASREIPRFAGQQSFPTVALGGEVFFFNRAEPRFPLPFFECQSPSTLLAARAFEFTVEAPWYLVSANGFDIQHFRCAHDRTLVGEPVVDSRHPFAFSLRARFRVTGRSYRDQLTRLFSGSEVEMSVESWCGNLVLVTAKFRRTTSYGMVSFAPMSATRTRVRNIVWVPRSRNAIARKAIDPLDAIVRRSFIREFVRSDAHRSNGISWHPGRMIEADNVLVEYLGWLQKVHS
jgi:nitrite reductase/ring-hydroxylating ferredoxin subunit